MLGAAMLQTVLKFPPDVIPQFGSRSRVSTPGGNVGGVRSRRESRF